MAGRGSAARDQAVPKKETVSKDRQQPAKTRGGWEPAGTSARRRASYGGGVGARGQKARADLMLAARRVFERDGYAAARIQEIVTEAGCSHGSFYTYFESKRDIFQQVAREVSTDMGAAVADMFTPGRSGLDPIKVIENAHRGWIRVYRENSRMLGLLEQVSTIDPVVHASRLSGRRRQISKIAGLITHWQHEGVANIDVDAHTTAGALQSVLSNFCYWWLVGGDDYSEENAVAVLTSVWARTIGISTSPGPAETGDSSQPEDSLRVPAQEVRPDVVSEGHAG